MHLKIYYAKNLPIFDAEPETINLHNLTATHVLVRELEATHLDEAYRQMQGEVWSPNGEARELIAALGLRHTSMTVGDIACDDGTYVTGNVTHWLCCFDGWLALHQKRDAERCEPNNMSLTV